MKKQNIEQSLLQWIEDNTQPIWFSSTLNHHLNFTHKWINYKEKKIFLPFISIHSCTHFTALSLSSLKIEWKSSLLVKMKYLWWTEREFVSRLVKIFCFIWRL